MGPYAGQVELQGLTIQHGWSNEGGGLRVAGGVVTAKDCHIKRCNSIFGGAVCVLGGRVKLNQCTLVDCGATFGGGVAVITGELGLNCTSTERCIAQASGGGVHLHGVDCTLTNVHFTNNRSANTTDVFFRDGELFLNNVTRTGPVYGIQAFSLDGPNLKVRLGPPSNH